MNKGIHNTYLGDYVVPEYKLGIEEPLYLYLGNEIIWSAGPEWEWAEWQMPADVNRNMNPDPDLYQKPMNSGLDRRIISDNDVLFSSSIWAWGNQLNYNIYSPVIKRTGGFTIAFDYSSSANEDPLSVTFSVLGSNADNGKFTAISSASGVKVTNERGSGHFTLNVPKLDGIQFYKLGIQFYTWNNSRQNNDNVSFRISNLIISRN